MRSYMYELSGQYAATMAREALRLRLEAEPEISEWDVSIPDDLVLDESTGQHRLPAREGARLEHRAPCARATLIGRREAGQLVLEVSDDGVGYDPAKVSDSSYGLRSIDHRVSMLRASLETDTAPGLGTRVV
ncbi:MAG: hypothetical protein U0360_05965 [Dehalococcoidia bacterium]